MKKNIYRFLFPNEQSAEKFIERIDKETSATAMHPFVGRQVKTNRKSVIVKGTDSLFYDLSLKNKCIEVCNALGGEFVS